MSANRRNLENFELVALIGALIGEAYEAMCELRRREPKASAWEAAIAGRLSPKEAVDARLGMPPEPDRLNMKAILTELWKAAGPPPDQPYDPDA